ncbi:MAG: hypothetical protein XD78_1861 [Desulfotomaculum sp. 46_296]|nr:MAG: hypothetical protein XD78_1861 [Desulfotomaculum sp. 46_296]HAU30814.1 hypothetical protein [Desulfotomaculum sp.]
MKPENNKLLTSTKIIYTAAILVFLIGIAFLADNIFLFKDTVAHYVAQGYPSAEVIKQLLPGQLLPGIFEPVAIYWGIAAVLFCAGAINQKLSYLIASINNENKEIGISEGKETDEEITKNNNTDE